jgi:hypothetical protein
MLSYESYLTKNNGIEDTKAGSTSGAHTACKEARVILWTGAI